MADQFDSPVDVTADTPRTAVSGLAQMAAGVGVATVALVLFNAHALAAWSGALEPGPISARIDAAAQGLAQRTAARGLDGPRAAIKQGWDRLKAADWPGNPQTDQRKKS